MAMMDEKCMFGIYAEVPQCIRREKGLMS